MEKRAATVRNARIAVRVSVEDQREVEDAAKTRGYSSPSAFVRTAIRNELHGREELVGIEDRISGSFERLSNENVHVLTSIPEPPAEARPQAVNLAKERYHRLVQSAAAGLSSVASARVS